MSTEDDWAQVAGVLKRDAGELASLPLAERVVAALEAFEQVSTAENYSMTDGGDGHTYAELFASLLDETLRTVGRVARQRGY